MKPTIIHPQPAVFLPKATYLFRSTPRISPKPKVLVMAARGRESLTSTQVSQLQSLATVHYQQVMAPLTQDQFVEAARDFDYLAITRRAIPKLGENLLNALPRLKGISVYSTGTEWIDADVLQARGIHLSSLPDYCTNAVAETALGLLFLSAHKLHLRYLKTTHAIPEHVSLRGVELRSGTVGIIGYGRIGKLLAQKAQPLCKRVLVYDADVEKQGFVSSGVVWAEKKALLQEADWLVCCAAQNFEEKQLLTPEEYELLQPKTTVINVARSSLLDHLQLVKKVKNQQLGGYYYDDLMPDGENPDEFEFGKIVPTGHTAWYTNESMQAGTAEWINNLCILIKHCPASKSISSALC